MTELIRLYFLHIFHTFCVGLYVCIFHFLMAPRQS